MTEPFSFMPVLDPASSQESSTQNDMLESQGQPAGHSARSRRRGSDLQAKPSELLQKIGLIGKEVVRILKSRDWEVCDPKALQENKLYYVPSGRAKGEQAKQGEDFFVGEGELYAFILENGGLHYLLPEETLSVESKMDSESEVESVDLPAFPVQSNVESEALKTNVEVHVQPSTSSEAQEFSNATLGDPSATTSENSAPGQPKRKRRKKFSTVVAKPAAKAKPAERLVHKSRKKVASSRDQTVSAPTECCVKEERIPFIAANGCGQLVEFGAYEAALTARGWRAQLLQDVDLHLLRSVAAISRRQLALEATCGEQKLFSGAGHDGSLNPGVLRELQAISSGIKASQNDLSSMIAAIIAQAERLHIPDRIECAARIGIPGFASSGSGNFVLLRDIERHILLLVAALRQYLRARKVVYCERDSLSSAADDPMQRSDLRALQLNIEKMNAELNELSTIISIQAEKLLRKDFPAPLELDADVETDSEQWLV
ncbi:hypothetical protein KRP22_014832 [Phytophthora ramorum]|uniref:uncharacterized protein n=1 Tax=Phytophthora ramorum TaxID=164328 RepID=UPI0030A1FD16|nr:hypothetical protein KRP23_11807 [Phytophthora ramorum]KAH7496220.1 hypothetical protein KRP22_14114 [Phytophthora ramorum]